MRAALRVKQKISGVSIFALAMVLLIPSGSLASVLIQNFMTTSFGASASPISYGSRQVEGLVWEGLGSVYAEK